MPRRDVQFSPGHYYHIYNRGADRQSIFRNEIDYHLALRLMKEVSTACQISMIAYCLIPNHYHWLVRQDGEAAANLLPKWVFGSYTRTFNNRHVGIAFIPGKNQDCLRIRTILWFFDQPLSKQLPKTYLSALWQKMGCKIVVVLLAPSGYAMINRR